MIRGTTARGASAAASICALLLRTRDRAKALRVDSRVASGMAGYRLRQTTDVTTDAGTTAFTIGFWVRGVQTGRAALSSALVAKLGGLKNGIGLNEDGSGLYYKRQSASPRGAMDFNDFAIWNRALTADEIASLYKAARPLSTLSP
ncbi:hypothetical protein ACSFBI_15785 [Variovorax sp. RB3P1]|uniref:hypothetical protein n=1 Tax=Variovorax sp. RB3P1 TaxID=3443732 RepID=UPI003F47D8F5